jgi:hypothetical protein
MKYWPLLILLFATSLLMGQTSVDGEIPGLNMYPNPVSDGTLNIRTPQAKTKQITVFDVFGAPVLQTNLSGEQLNVSSLPAGVYVIRITEERKTATRKLIVK